MWRTFHELRNSAQFRELWKSFFVQVMKDPVHPHLYQHITEILFRKMVQVKVTVLDHTESDIIQPITESEENALRYAAGYVCKKVREFLY